jgi:hypothetical protein
VVVIVVHNELVAVAHIASFQCVVVMLVTPTTCQNKSRQIIIVVATKRYVNIELLKDQQMRGAITA